MIRNIIELLPYAKGETENFKETMYKLKKEINGSSRKS